MWIDYYEKISGPIIPSDLLQPDPDIIIKNHKCVDPNLWSSGYGNFEPNQELEAWLQEWFDEEVIVRYQIILNDLPPHKDVCVQDYKLNYLYSLGGDNVTTQWWQNDKNVCNKVCDLYTWYKLNVKIRHSVINITEPRMSVTVKYS